MAAFSKLDADLALMKAMGRKEYARAIEIMRSQLAGQISDAEDLANMAQCHDWLGEELRAIEVAREALEVDTGCFEAHRVLASIKARRGEHALAALHAQQAIRVFRPAPEIPRWVRNFVMVLVRLRRGRAAANAERQRVAKHEAYNSAWLEWARQYLKWNDVRGTLVAANERFRHAPRAVPN